MLAPSGTLSPGDGLRVIGTWSNQRRGNRWSLEIEAFEKFSKSIRTKIEEEARSLGDFLETSCDIKFSK